MNILKIFKSFSSFGKNIPTQIKPNIDVVQSRQLINKLLGNNQFVLLDVRTPDQYKKGHIQGCKHIQLQFLQQNLNQLDKQNYFLVYCRSGRRSDTAANLMRAKGFNKVSNMVGGILEWNQHRFPITSIK